MTQNRHQKFVLFHHYLIRKLMMKRSLINLPCILGASLLLTACGSNAVNDTIATNTQTESVVSQNNDDLYQVNHEGRIYLFDDFNTYQTFLEVGETAYRKVRIGEGPRGETLVFGLTNEDKKKTQGIASLDMYDGKLEGANNFYGETRTEEGRIYVFSSLEEMTNARIVGEVPLRFTEIGSGPKGETVVYALNSDNKKVKPESLIEAFKLKNQL